MGTAASPRDGERVPEGVRDARGVPGDAPRLHARGAARPARGRGQVRLRVLPEEDGGGEGEGGGLRDVAGRARNDCLSTSNQRGAASAPYLIVTVLGLVGGPVRRP